MRGVPDQIDDDVVDTLTLRFVGEDEEGSAIHELRAAHVAEVLQGVVGLASDFDKAGVFSPEGPSGSEVLVRPAKEGSFLIEVVRVLSENWETAVAAGGIPSLSTVIWWATRSARADVKDFDYLENGNVKVTWQDDTAQEVPAAAWEELQKRTRRRKKQLRQIMAPLSDPNVTSLEVASPASEEDEDTAQDDAPEVFVLTRPDYNAVKPEDDIEETQEIFEVEAQMSAIDFDDPTKWRVRTKDRSRSASVEDQVFLGRVANGLAIRKNDIFRLRIREDVTKKNGRTRTAWTVLRVESYRRAAGDES
ncbi:hypothetical protein D3226_05835 [Leucobacter chromiireducens subsp. chromiireducens]|uniref:Uncharacterized protein n=1 Tax=Leucobacter chromiireducens subsp. chromiireducens TaxID=660067 RepID=A0ABS1SRD8_9MICO|nr:hypothetical protein [Leucobacter chromiireducens subsp. chromiireducens]